MIRWHHWFMTTLLAVMLHAGAIFWLMQTQNTVMPTATSSIEIYLGEAELEPSIAEPTAAEPVAQTEPEPITESGQTEPEIDTPEHIPETFSIAAVSAMLPALTQKTPVTLFEEEKIKKKETKPRSVVKKSKPQRLVKKEKSQQVAQNTEPQRKQKTSPVASKKTSPASQQPTYTKPAQTSFTKTTAKTSIQGASSSQQKAIKRQYYAQLAAWLNRNKRYPKRAQKRRQEGVVKLTFTINRNGRVLNHRIVTSSGYSLLDREVKNMLQRAAPLPRIPAELQQVSLTVTVPITFSLR